MLPHSPRIRSRHGWSTVLVPLASSEACSRVLLGPCTSEYALAPPGLDRPSSTIRTKLSLSVSRGRCFRLSPPFWVCLTAVFDVPVGTREFQPDTDHRILL